MRILKDTIENYYLKLNSSIIIDTGDITDCGDEQDYKKVKYGFTDHFRNSNKFKIYNVQVIMIILILALMIRDGRLGPTQTQSLYLEIEQEKKILNSTLQTIMSIIQISTG